MATVKPPSKNERTKAVQTKPTDLTPPEETTVLQIVNMPTSLKNDYKAYTAKSPYKNMAELFKAMFEEYKDNHPL